MFREYVAYQGGRKIRFYEDDFECEVEISYDKTKSHDNEYLLEKFRDIVAKLEENADYILYCMIGVSRRACFGCEGHFGTGYYGVIVRRKRRRSQTPIMARV